MGFINEKAVDHREMEVRAKLFTAYPGETSTVTQTTSRSTNVTIHATAGTIITDDTSLAAGATATFTVVNRYVTSEKTMVLIVMSTDGTSQTSVPYVDDISAGSFRITVRNLNASTADTGTMGIGFIIIDVN